MLLAMDFCANFKLRTFFFQAATDWSPFLLVQQFVLVVFYIFFGGVSGAYVTLHMYDTVSFILRDLGGIYSIEISAHEPPVNLGSIIPWRSSEEYLYRGQLYLITAWQIMNSIVHRAGTLYKDNERNGQIYVETLEILTESTHALVWEEPLGSVRAWTRSSRTRAEPTETYWNDFTV